jgi:hypothetical protein
VRQRTTSVEARTFVAWCAGRISTRAPVRWPGTIDAEAHNDEKQLILECDGITAVNAFFKKHAIAFGNAGYTDKEITQDAAPA